MPRCPSPCACSSTGTSWWPSRAVPSRWRRSSRAGGRPRATRCACSAAATSSGTACRSCWAMSEPRVLVVDDDEALRLMLGTMLGDAGYEVRGVDAAAAMREALAEWKPDLLLLDILLPDANGVDLLQELKASEDWRELPVLMISARTPDEMTELALGLGAADVIKKPFRPRALVARVQAQLRLYARHHLARPERLLDDVGRTEPERQFGHLIGRARRDHEHGEFPPVLARLQLLQQVHAIGVGEQDVEQQQVGLPLRQRLSHRRRRIHSAHLIPGVAQHRPEHQ